MDLFYCEQVEERESSGQKGDREGRPSQDKQEFSSRDGSRKGPRKGLGNSIWVTTGDGEAWSTCEDSDPNNVMLPYGETHRKGGGVDIPRSLFLNPKQSKQRGRVLCQGLYIIMIVD